MVIALMILAVVVAAFSEAFVGSTFAASDARLREEAATVADTALDKARSVTPPSTLLSDGPTVTTAPTGVTFTNMTSVVKLAPQTTTLDNRVFTANLYAGPCYLQSSGSCTTTSTGSPPPMIEVIADVTWTAPTCGSSGCYYVASTLFSNGSDSTLDVNPNDAPNAPTDVTAAAGNQTITVSWTAATDTDGLPITGYTVSYTGGTGGTCVPSPSTATTCTISGLVNETTYTFSVTATSPGGTSVASTPVTATPSDPPNAPSGLTASDPAGGSVHLTWSAPTTDIYGTTVSASSLTYYVTDAACPSSPTTPPAGATAVTMTSYTYTGLTNGTLYSFCVYADTSQGQSSGASTTATPNDDPAAPTGTSASAVSGGATVTWTAPTKDVYGTTLAPGAVSQYVVTATASGATTQTCSTTTTSCAFSSANGDGLSNGYTYTFSVVADSSGGNSASSSTATATPLSTPTGLTATPGSGSETIGWTMTPTTNVTGYTVTVTSGTTTVTTKTCSGATTTSCTVSGLTNGTTYTFSVTANYGTGNSATSGTVSGYVGTPSTPGKPSGSNSGTTSRYSIGLSWTASTGAATYTIVATDTTHSTYSTTITGVTTNSDTITSGLHAGDTYTFAVYATNPAGNSSTSTASSGIAV